MIIIWSNDFFSSDFLIKERDLITSTISFTTMQNKNGIHFLNPTDELIFLMITFMGVDCSFLEADIKSLLKLKVEYFLANNINTTFNFDETYGEGKCFFFLI